ncbi:hypothetical protein, partial [Xanthomonas arboricola]|uniref:hypothetical protein n=1 Tax=Xanthomonas arboricola TaxID=56448 RepID=UPI0040408D6A
KIGGTSEAALGSVPPGIEDDETKKMFKGHASQWFKSRAGGRELATKIFAQGIWPRLEPCLTPFLTVIRQAVHD